MTISDQDNVYKDTIYYVYTEQMQYVNKQSKTLAVS